MITEEIRNRYEIIVGLEVHAQMLTQSKAYATDSTEYGQMPNTNISVLTLGHPGTLPRFNKKVLEYAILMGLACGSKITRYNIFDRKNYFYPDLPKGYQITQDKTPICWGGKIAIELPDGTAKTINITRIHMEEDAGKSLHLAEETDTLVDLNRAGVPLIEIVSEPEMRSGEEAYAYLTEIRRLVRYLNICDGNMEEGSMRCDANVSVRKKGETTLRTRNEIKNMNSIRNVQRAIEFEALRQIEIYENQGTVKGETRMFDATTGETYAMRTKETLNDYRYFPEPDLQPVVVTDEYIESVRAQMPSLPNELKAKFMQTFGLPEYDAKVLIDDKDTALYFEALCSQTTAFKAASNWIMGPVKSYLNERTLPMQDFPLSTKRMAELIALVESNQISFAKAAQDLFPALLESPEISALDMAKKLDIIQDSNQDNILPIITEVLAQYPDKVAAYKSGKKGLLGMFMGEVMKQTKGKADPKVTSKLLQEQLDA
ncbi:MAG: Asp-tRNA(Asn)/Glu-tRNA(Gln) amidotransferase subunit GatB [Bernardetiaceae bacterium]|nr:Asp-tRNA(Asn)/Glu-tRNA(Gln) amidotransferase subunit GatB [Bernardetiaceae bacterium]